MVFRPKGGPINRNATGRAKSVVERVMDRSGMSLLTGKRAKPRPIPPLAQPSKAHTDETIRKALGKKKK